MDAEDHAKYGDTLEVMIKNGLYGAYGVSYDKNTKTYSWGGNTYTSIEQVEANVKLSQATLSLGNEALAVGTSKKLTPVFTYANDTSLNKDAIFTWSSSNPEVATVDENGLVCAVAAGETTITVTACGGLYATECTVSVTFNWNVTGWTFFGQGADLWYYDSGSAMSGTGTIIYDGTKLTLTLTKGEAAYDKDITDADIISGAKSFELNANCLAGYQSITISAIELGVYVIPPVEATTETYVRDVNGNEYDASVADGVYTYAIAEAHGQSAAITLPKINFTENTKVTFNWSVSGWAMFGQGTDLWYYDSGSAMSGTGTIIYDGTKLTLTLTKGDSSHDKDITDADIIGGAKSFELNFYAFSNQTITIGAIELGQLPPPVAPAFVMDAATYNADGKVADASTTENGASYSLFEGAGYLTIAKVDFNQYTMVTYDWTLSGWTQFGVGADLWYYDGGSQMVGTVTVTNNGNGTLTMAVTKGESSYSATISDADVINGTKALTMNFNGLASYQSFTVSNFTVA